MGTKFFFGPWWFVAGAMTADALIERRRQKKQQQVSQYSIWNTPEKQAELKLENERIKKYNEYIKKSGYYQNEVTEKRSGGPLDVRSSSTIRTTESKPQEKKKSNGSPF